MARRSVPREPHSRDVPPGRRLGALSLVWHRAARYPGHVAVAVGALLTTSLVTASLPYPIRAMIDKGFANGGDHGQINRVFAMMAGLVVLLSMGTALRFYFVSWLGERVVADVRKSVQDNLLRLSPRFFEENRPAEIASRLTADTAQIETAVGSTVSVALRNLVTGALSIATMFVLAPKLAGSLLLGIPIVTLPIIFFSRRVRGSSRTSQDRIADIGAIAVETLAAMKLVQAFGQERREGQRFAGAVEAGFDAAKRRIRIRTVMTALVILLLFGAITALLWSTVSDVAAGRLSGGSLTGSLLAATLVAGSFGALTEVYGDLLRAAGAAERLAELLAERPEIVAPPHPVPLSSPARGALHFEGVTFRYPTRPEVAALDDLTLHVHPGETVAVVGPSGAGKSTLFQLAERFYDPQAGSVLLDGIDLRHADPAAVRARIALVPQETVMFAATARDNLRYGRWSASDAELWAAAEAANAVEFLRALPQGLDTPMGEGGARLSGGQRQRIAIARALLRDAPLLLLDEATSALDAESERVVQQALERLMADRTTLVIAHRLATVRAADRIVVMDGGRIVEQGNHTALIARGGLYARLASLQFSEAA